MKTARENEFSPSGSDFDEDLMDQLQNPENAAHFIMAAIDEKDADYLKVALGKVAKVHGISNISKLTELPRQTLYRMLAPDGNPSLDNVQQILNACGLAFAVVPKERVKEFAAPSSTQENVAPTRSQLKEIAGDLAELGGQLQSVAQRLNLGKEGQAVGRKKKAR